MDEVETWIHEHADEMRDIDISWSPAPPDQGVYYRLLEILFAPRADNAA